MRKILIGVLVLVVLGAGAAAGWHAYATKDVLTVMCLTRTEAEALEKTAIQPYLAAYPDAQVTVDYLYEGGDDTPWDLDTTYAERVTRSLHGDADVFSGVPAEYLPELIRAGAIEQLDAFISGRADVTESMAPAVSTILEAQGNGSLYALAPGFGSIAMAYNADLFDAAGVDYPEGTLTWDEAFALGQAVASASSSSTAAFSFGPESLADFYSAFIQHGPSAGVYVIDAEKVIADERFAEVWDVFAQARKNHTQLKDGDAFWRGEVALALVYNGQVDDPATFQSDPTFARFRWDLAPAPVFDATQPVSYANIQGGLVMASSCDDKDAARDLMCYLAGPEFAPILGAMPEQPWAGSLPSSETTAALAALRTRADKNYSAFYTNAAPRPRARSSNGYGYSYVTFLLQRLMVDTINGRIDSQGAREILEERGPRLYATTDAVDPGDPAALRTLLGY